MCSSRFLLLAFLSLAAAVSPARAEPRIYMIGNSLTDEVQYDAFADQCEAGGTLVMWARKMIPGAPLRWHLSHPTDGFQKPPFGHPPTAFTKYGWDHLTLQPFNPAEVEIPATLAYCDALNNREATYNRDDRRFIIGSDGRVDRSASIGSWLAMLGKGKPIDGGYFYEATIDLKRLGIPPNLDIHSRANKQKHKGRLKVVAFDGVVFGFDVMNRDVDTDGGDPAVLVWQGSATNSTDPSQFGTAILMPAERR